MASAAGRPGARASPHRRATTRRPRPSPHARRSPTPHWGWRRHPARRSQPAGGRAHPGCQDSCSRYLLTINLTSVHVLQGLLGILWGLELYIGVAPGQVRMEPVRWHVDYFDLPVGGENLLDVVLSDISSQSSQVKFGRFRTRTSPLPFLLLSSFL